MEMPEALTEAAPTTNGRGKRVRRKIGEDIEVAHGIKVRVVKKVGADGVLFEIVAPEGTPVETREAVGELVNPQEVEVV